MMHSPYVTAVIVAAGNSTRMGFGVSKQFIPLNGHPVIEYTLKAFESAASISEIIIVCRPADKEHIQDIVNDIGASKVKALVDGGSQRSESVYNGVMAASPQTTHFAIHDGARPLISAQDIDRVASYCLEHGAVSLGTPVTDTIKVVNSKGEIISTPDRSTLMAVQTPQVFEKELYLRAVEFSKGNSFTDDCAMVEAFGVSPVLIKGDSTNIKLTTQNDIPVAESILKTKVGLE